MVHTILYYTKLSYTILDCPVSGDLLFGSSRWSEQCPGPLGGGPELTRGVVRKVLGSLSRAPVKGT